MPAYSFTGPARNIAYGGTRNTRCMCQRPSSQMGDDTVIAADTRRMDDLSGDTRNGEITADSDEQKDQRCAVFGAERIGRIYGQHLHIFLYRKYL